MTATDILTLVFGPLLIAGVLFILLLCGMAAVILKG